jgi:hypothetical protein
MNGIGEKMEAARVVDKNWMILFGASNAVDSLKIQDKARVVRGSARFDEEEAADYDPELVKMIIEDTVTNKEVKIIDLFDCSTDLLRIPELIGTTLGYVRKTLIRAGRLAKTSRYGGGKRKVVQLTLDGKFVDEFDSHTHAAEMTGIGRVNISAACSGGQKTAGGYIFKSKEKYLEEEK